LTRGTLLALTAAGHRLRRLLQILLQTIDAVSERVFSFAKLLACLLRVFVLRVLTTAARKVFHVFRDLTLS